MTIGLYGPEYVQFSDGGPARRVPIFVFLPGTKTKAILRSDFTGLHTASNPVYTDDRGELTFFIDEGQYDLHYDGPGLADFTTSVIVDPSPGAQTFVGGYEHTVVSSALSIQIPHGLSWKPQPLSLDSGGIQVEHDRVSYPSPGVIEVMFGAPFGPGKIYLS